MRKGRLRKEREGEIKGGRKGSKKIKVGNGGRYDFFLSKSEIEKVRRKGDEAIRVEEGRLRRKREREGEERRKRGNDEEKIK